ncbi:MAG TPA: phage tail protein [Bryobacteraceae bacterium]|jgi:hypothetical protein|nr:phage tail protein [Bryobacteraceae bacterium]
MATINQAKQLAEADTPLLFFQCVLPSGINEYWCTHATSFAGQTYAARILKHNLFELQLSADDAMDGISQLSITLANADSYMSEINREVGFKGTQLTVFVAFASLPRQTVTTESTVLFRGVAGDPDEITEDSLRVTFTNKLSLQRIPLPDVRIQRSCPWTFPTTIAQRTEAVSGGASGRYSRFYKCGYSADIKGGVGNLNNGAAFTSCDGSRTQCQQRGMFAKDSHGNITQRFGAFEFVPSAILVRTAGDKTSHVSPLVENSAKYNDPVPIVYGTGWLKAPVDFARNDGNLTHLEVILGIGVVQGVLKVVVNDIEIPQGIAGTNMTSTGWYSVVTRGTRGGSFNYDFTDSHGSPLGDPYGSIAVLSIVVPNRIASGSSLPTVEVLTQGMQLDSYNLDGTFNSTDFSNNPAWIILDILRRSGWSNSEIDLASFARAAGFCGELISTTDSNGNPLQVPRFQCNLFLTKRQSAAVVIRGIRVASSLMLRYGSTGLLQLAAETSIAAQQPALPDGSNSAVTLSGGWPAYEFSDASGSFSGIVRNPNGSSTVRLTSRSVAETSNRLSVEFQDAFNEYQQDSLSIVDSDDSSLIGYEISSQSTALGIANMSQATRVLLRQLDKSTAGNLYVQFQTSFRALKVRPGDIITLTYAKEGLLRTPFRVIKLAPSLNYEVVTILAQIHDDNWYSDNPAVLAGAGRQPFSQVQTPRPLIGLVAHNDAHASLEFYDFQVTEQLQSQSDGSATDTLTVGFSMPNRPQTGSLSLPLLSLSPQYQSSGGNLISGSTLYYAVSALDGAGNEGSLSFTVPVLIPGSGETNTVTISGLSFPKGAATFNVYRGANPQLLYRIATAVALSSSFTDTGLPPTPAGPPDSSFDHANFYYRKEYAGAFIATSWSATTISCQDMGAVPLAYVGRVARIVEGTGRGQERTISTNDATSLTVTSAWSVLPDTTSQFVVVDSSWKFAAVSATTPIQFELAYQPGMVIEITGRAANVNNLEASPDLCPVTRCALGGGRVDSGTTLAPDFTLTAPGSGLLTLSQVGFDELTNVSSVSSGTLEIFSWNELSDPTQYSLNAALDTVTSSIVLAQPGPAYSGQIIQIGSELMAVLSVNNATNTYSVLRGSLGSSASTHNVGDAILHLTLSAVIVPFALNFFDNRAALNFTHTITMPDIRVCAAQFFVTNAFGDSLAKQLCYTTGPAGGLRTLSGGQFSLQVGSTLATQQNAAPPLLIEASHAVRDLRAQVTQAPSGYDVSVDVMQNGLKYCTLTIPSGATVSSVVDGVGLAPLTERAVLTVNVTLNVLQSFQASMNPGRDLTVTIRL